MRDVCCFCWKFYKFAANINKGKDQATVSKWCTNTSQPDLPTLTKVAEILNVDIKELLNSTKDT